MNDPNMKDWSQYKATHPDEYSPVPGTQDDYHGKLYLKVIYLFFVVHSFLLQ